MTALGVRVGVGMGVGMGMRVVVVARSVGMVVFHHDHLEYKKNRFVVSRG